MVAKARSSGVAAAARISASALVIVVSLSVVVGLADVRVRRRLTLLTCQRGPRGDEVGGVRRDHVGAVAHRVDDLPLGPLDLLLEVLDALLGLGDDALDGLGGVVVLG